MNEKSYPFEIGVDGLIYKFESVSANKKIVKTVSFERLGKAVFSISRYSIR